MTPTEYGYELDPIVTVSFFLIFLMIVTFIGLLCAAFMKHAGAAYRATLMELAERRRRR